MSTAPRATGCRTSTARPRKSPSYPNGRGARAPQPTTVRERAVPATLPRLQGTFRRVRSYDGAVLHVVVAGEGPTLVLSHGALVPAGSWAPVWQQLLRANYRLIAYDLRGRSPASRRASSCPPG